MVRLVGRAGTGRRRHRAVEHRPRVPRPGPALLGVPSRDVRPRPQVAADAVAALTCAGPEPVRRHRPAAAAPGLRRPGLGGGDAAGPRSLVLVSRRGRTRRVGGLGAGGRAARHRPQPHRDRGLLDGRLRGLQAGVWPIRRCSPRRSCWPARRPAACGCCPTSTFRATWTRTRTARARATPCGCSSMRGGFRSSSPTACSTSWCRCPRSCSRCTSSTGSPTATGSPSIRPRTTSRGCSRTSSTIRFRTWAPVPGRATPDTSPSRGIRSWCGPTSALGRTKSGGCRT